MGNQTTLMNQEAVRGTIDCKTNLEDQLTSYGDQGHTYFEKIQSWKINRTGEKIFSKVLYGSNQTDKRQMELWHNKRCQINNPSILRYYGCVFYEKYELFANFLEQHAFIEWPNQSLRQVIQFHKENLSYIPESKILQVLHQVTGGLKFLKEFNNISHGDLTPDSIFICKDQSAKILEVSSFPNLQSGYLKLLYKRGQALLSPLELILLKQKSVNPQVNQYKCDIFSLGMVALEMMTQKDSFRLYDFNNTEINRGAIQQSLNEAHLIGYSDETILILKQMLESDEQNRISTENLFSVLSRRRENIVDKPFVQRSSRIETATNLQGKWLIRNISPAPSPILQQVQNPKDIRLSPENRQRRYINPGSKPYNSNYDLRPAHILTYSPQLRPPQMQFNQIKHNHNFTEPHLVQNLSGIRLVPANSSRQQLDKNIQNVQNSYQLASYLPVPQKQGSETQRINQIQSNLDNSQLGNNINKSQVSKDEIYSTPQTRKQAEFNQIQSNYLSGQKTSAGGPRSQGKVSSRLDKINQMNHMLDLALKRSQDNLLKDIS